MIDPGPDTKCLVLMLNCVHTVLHALVGLHSVIPLIKLWRTLQIFWGRGNGRFEAAFKPKWLATTSLVAQRAIGYNMICYDMMMYRDSLEFHTINSDAGTINKKINVPMSQD